MSKILLVVFKDKDPGRLEACRYKAEQLMHLLTPDHLAPTVKVENDEFTSLFLINERNNVLHHQFNICTGTFVDPPADWWKHKSMPSSASLFITTDQDQCTVMTNSVAGRCTWYYFDDDKFIVSTSQRAIVAWLGSFQSNPQAISWMLATGNLGPGNSWDQRIHHAGASTTISLNRNQWLLKKTTQPFLFSQAPKSLSQLKTELRQTLDQVFSQLKVDVPFTALTLSGGYDSRSVLYYFVKNGILVPTVTWGLSSSLNESNTDAYVARLLADKLGVPHRFFATDFFDLSFDTVFDRFLKSGEGRLDHINTFMDGLRMWKSLSESGIRQIIRADEVFGWLPAQTEQDVLISLDMHRMEDNANMLPLKSFDLSEQYFPEEYLRKEHETLEEWRDRLYRQFRLPYVLTGLHDVAHSYVEVINPFLHEEVISFCNGIPDHLRTQKKLYVDAVTELIPGIPIARKASIPEPAAIFRYARIVSVILNELSSEEARTFLGREFLSALPEHLYVDDNLINRTNNSFKLMLKSVIPWQLKKILRRDLVKYQGDFNQLAFRAAIVTRMHRLLKNDTESFKKISDLTISTDH